MAENQTKEKEKGALISQQQLWLKVELNEKLMPQPKNMAEMYFVCQHFSRSKMVKQDYRDDPEKMMVAWIMGNQIGLNFFGAMKWIAVIEGNPSVYGDGALSLIRKSGKLEWIKEKVVGAGDDMVAHCLMKRKGEPADVIYSNTFSVEDAIRAGLWGNVKKITYQKYPKRMLVMRARSLSMRDGFSDILEGIGIYEEEQEIYEQTVEGKTEDEPQEAVSKALYTEGELVEAEYEEKAPESEPASPPAQPAPGEELEPESVDQPLGARVSIAKQFEKVMEGYNLTERQAEALPIFIKNAMNAWDATVTEIMEASMEPDQIEGFIANLKEFAKSNFKKPEDSEPEGDKSQDTSFWKNRNNWINLRERGFTEAVSEHLTALDSMSDDFIYSEIWAKWRRIYNTDEQMRQAPFPLMSRVIRYMQKHKIDPKHLVDGGSPGETPPVTDGPVLPERSRIPDSIRDLKHAIATELEYDSELVHRMSDELNIPVNSMNINECQILLKAIYEQYGIDPETIDQD
jgi:hypothetical protein